MTPDVGDIDPGLEAALADGDRAAIAAALVTARLLVPIIATGEESSAATMSVPGLVGADGRHALPVFSCYDALRRWHPAARPVPMIGSQALAAASAEGYAAVVLDVAGPAAHVVELDPAEQPPAAGHLGC